MDSANTALTGKSRQTFLGNTLLQINAELIQYYRHVRTGTKQETNTSYKFIPTAQHYNIHDDDDDKAIFCVRNKPTNTAKP